MHKDRAGFTLPQPDTGDHCDCSRSFYWTKAVSEKDCVVKTVSWCWGREEDVDMGGSIRTATTKLKSD